VTRKTVDETVAENAAAAQRHRDGERTRHRLALENALNPDRVKALLVAYEKTGDHNHGRGPLPPNATCHGGDCIVERAVRIIAAMRIEQQGGRR